MQIFANFLTFFIIITLCRDRFGSCAIRSSERDNLQTALQPCIVYIIKRLQAMVSTIFVSNYSINLHDSSHRLTFLFL
jgi:hypothetical protein